jgi:hypothetical protein
MVGIEGPAGQVGALNDSDADALVCLVRNLQNSGCSPRVIPKEEINAKSKTATLESANGQPARS